MCLFKNASHSLRGRQVAVAEGFKAKARQAENKKVSSRRSLSCLLKLVVTFRANQKVDPFRTDNAHFCPHG